MKSKQYITFMAMITEMFFAIPARADLSFYTDKSDWEAAVDGDIITEDFDSVTPYFLAEGINSAGIIDIEMVNLAQANEFNSMNDGSFFLNIDGTPFIRGACYPSPSNTEIIIHLPSPATAFGGDFSSTYSSDKLTLQMNGSRYEFSDLMPSGDGVGFLGFISMDPFSNVTLLTLDDEDIYYGESFGLDNVKFVEVPEPMTLSLLGLGALCLRKRRKIWKLNKLMTH